MELLKTDPLKLTTQHNFSADRGIGFLALENEQLSKVDKKSGDIKKIADFIKNSNIRVKKNVENQSIVTRINAVPFYQTLKQIPWPLKLEKLTK